MKKLNPTILTNLLTLYLLFICNYCFATKKPIKVTVTQLPEQVWMLEYQLPKAVNQVQFYRPGDLSRADWRLFDKNLSMKKLQPNKTAINSVNGALFDTFKIQFKSNFNHLEKDYELNQQFSDGGLTLYTGHLVLSLNEEKLRNHTFKLVSMLGNHSIVKGQVSSLAQYWTDDFLQGTYVYFGSSKILKTDHMLAVLDQQLPSWIRDEMMTALPTIFQHYTEKFKQPLNETPMVLFSYKTTEESGTQYSGGALSGVIQLKLTGKDWQIKSKQNLSKFLHFIAHEATHLWNAQMIPLSGEHDESWIHEGSAEYLSVKILQELGIYNEDDVHRENEKYLNNCIDDLKNNAVTEFDKHKNFGAFYSCGAVIAYLSEKAMQVVNPNSQLFDLWADLIQRVKENNLQLTTKQYVKSLLLFSKNNKIITNLMAFLDEPQLHPIEFFNEFFKEVDIKLKTNSKHPNKAQQVIQTTIKHLMMIDCKSYSYENHQNYYTVGNMKNCSTLRPGMKISKIEGLTLDKAHDIYTITQEKCQNNNTIELQPIEDDRLLIACNSQMPNVNPWLSFEM